MPKRRRPGFQGRVYTGEEAQRIVSRIRAFTAASPRPVEALRQYAGVSWPTAYKWLNSDVASIRHATVVKVARNMGLPITALWESKLHDTQALDTLYETGWSSYPTAAQAESSAQVLLMSLLRHCHGKGWILDYLVRHSVDAYPNAISVDVRRNCEALPCWHFAVREVDGALMLFVYANTIDGTGEVMKENRILLTRTTFLKVVKAMEAKMKSKKQSNGRPPRTQQGARTP